MMCFMDWMTLDDDGGEGDELCYRKDHLWKKRELKVRFMNAIKGCRKKKAEISLVRMMFSILPMIGTDVGHV